MRFVKGHGTGNDFVIVPDPDGDLDLTPELVRALCDRRTGVGADGVLRVVLAAAEPGLPGTAGVGRAGEARWFMDYRNADGSLAEMCGNGLRVFGRYLVDAGYERPGLIPVATRAGVRGADVPSDGEVTVEMGPPSIGPLGGVTVTIAGRVFQATNVSMGNPHAVCFADDLNPAGLAGLDLTVPPVIPTDAFPAGANVEVVVGAPDTTRMRVYERGVGETSSCGTGACAVAVVSATRAGQGPGVAIPVDLPGGRLTVLWDTDQVRLRGPAVLVSDGLLRADWLAAARAAEPALA
ncbi:diaminopimelate epimerase [Frankia sp. CNm7]|uniref:Diaminopimelate epimerase n=1 Tax=Frankia nepalensis TaxID=1836974 RepID=A0A937RMD9_9ACTN|nr:diaminopimelate epimerase [Frankia nepalensis]MBL7501004.1 diaminopimelate epimerase [Frankia nepalensis]MBL7512479.1 diaminopimelate epimerase [Frankia nepalensis]MBL7521494.1 diaminopimelate epimerase [Frankia nepalensis]MBL7632782.1 diaminopimelate epimerase [Frankia nepalensis]